MKRFPTYLVVLTAAVVVLTLAGAACGDSGVPADSTEPPESTTIPGSGNGTLVTLAPPAGLPALTLEPVAAGFTRPSLAISPPGDDRLFVVEVDGRIWVVEGGEVAADPFLDVGERLAANGEGDARGRGERGLVALAFHPDYAANGRLFIYYADLSGISELVEYTVSSDPNRAEPDGTVLMEFGPTIRHYGGALGFAPDGFLWLSIGEGGVRRNAQDVDIPRGGILRLDVSVPGVASPAPGNPFGGSGDGAALWAIGLRNPWRWSIDAESGVFFVGDVGHQTVEEINAHPLAEPGANFGWSIVEGTACFAADTCDTDGLAPPMVEHLHSEGACAIVGGQVYRGSAIPGITGLYFYSDFCGGWLRSFRLDGGRAVDAHVWMEGLGPVTAITTDADGELIVVTIDGRVRRVVPA